MCTLSRVVFAELEDGSCIVLFAASGDFMRHQSCQFPVTRIHSQVREKIKCLVRALCNSVQFQVNPAESVQGETTPRSFSGVIATRREQRAPVLLPVLL